MKTILVALKEIKGNQEFLMKLSESYIVKSTIYLSSLNHWLKKEICDLVVIEPGVESHGFFFDPKLLDKCGTEFYRQRILPKGIPTIFLSKNEECRKTIETLFPNAHFGEKDISLTKSIKEIIGE